jgi:elongation factor G
LVAAGSGKTTLAEAMLFEGGVISRRGDIGNQRTTVSDYHKVEHEYGYSVFHRCYLPNGWARKSTLLIVPDPMILLGVLLHRLM